MDARRGRAWLLGAILGLLAQSLAPLLHARTLHWSALEVDAELDAEGRLHVVERHSMVFDGAWNGGERTFRVRGTQRLQFLAMRRIDTATGTAVRLSHGDLDRVDHYSFTDRTTLRWRSRLPGDPPFSATPLVYELEYALSNVLQRDSEGYVLDHDFAFPDRDSVIGDYTLRLRVDPAWLPQDGVHVPLSVARTNLAPGQSVVVTLPLRFTSAGLPAAVRAPASALWLLPALVPLLVFVVWRFRRYMRHEQHNGRFEPLTPTSAIDQAWLNEHVFRYPPEAVGSLWDSSTGAAEVAAILARLVQEGKLTSRIDVTRRFVFRRSVLHLEIPNPRPAFNTYESKLIEALFVDGDTTDTERIREHYRKRRKTFDPATKIRRYLPAKGRTSSRNAAALQGGWKLSLFLAVLTAAAYGSSLALEIGRGMTETFVLLSLACVVLSVAFGIWLIALGYGLRRNVSSPRRQLVWLLSIYTVCVAALLVIARGADGHVHWTIYFAIAASAALIFNLMLNRALTRVSPRRIVERKNLCAARAYFADQLRRAEPELEDAWYPYLIAFGLDKSMERWFSRFGPEPDVTPARGTSAVSGGLAGSRSSWTGGGGSFGGAGASGAWSAAAGAMASGVSAASSGSSSGGGGGSSGGGGGGGW